MSLDPQRVKALFQSALDHAGPADRAAFLDRECGAEVELRHRLDLLLAAFDQPATALERPLAAEATAADFALGATAAPPGPTIGEPEPRPATRADDHASPVGATIAGRYKVRQAIGEGGMGTVYLAEQVAPVKRLVALKLIRAGMDSKQVLARFESERQALAIMDHPHIARVLDAGTTESGHPFFVMELVRGIPLTDYCDRHRLGLPARLQLFRQVCAAVQHAHQKGIIHRDLKPTNILVEDHDGTPVPKVIDFGLAKAITGLQLSEQTVFTAFGSIQGTPLYMAPEQATFNAIDVDTRADIYALGVILYELLTGSTPIRRESIQRAALDEMLRLIRDEEPPTPSSRISTSEGLPDLAANRLVEPTRLGRFVRGDLDWIVMKALAKERSRRYDSAIGLANDVERFLHDEPVTAGPPTARYRVAKFVRRHRGRVAATALVLLALVGGVIGTTLGLLEARNQARLANAQVIETEKAQSDTVRRSREASKRLQQSHKIIMVLASIFDVLDPHTAETEGKPLAALLGERLDQASAALDGESVGSPQEVAAMQAIFGQAQLSLGHYKEAIALYSKWRRAYPSNSDSVNPATIGNLDNLAIAYLRDGQLDQAVPLLEQRLTGYEAQLGPDHPFTLISMSNLADAYQAGGQLDRAVPLLEQALTSRKAKLGPDHPDTLASMNSLADAYEKCGQLDRAADLLREVADARGKRDGREALPYADSLGALGAVLINRERWADAEAVLRECLAIRERKAADDWLTFQARSLLGEALLGQGRWDEARPPLESGYEGLRRRTARIPTSAKSFPVEALDRLIRLAEATNRPDEARARREEKARLDVPADPASPTQPEAAKP